jgi:hypothetical protein
MVQTLKGNLKAREFEAAYSAYRRAEEQGRKKPERDAYMFYYAWSYPYPASALYVMS